MNKKTITKPGDKFNRLTVISRSGFTKNGDSTWLCLCICGNKKVVSAVHLRKGSTQSCGCLAVEKARVLNTTHGMSKTRPYRIWRIMKQRVTNIQDKDYERYGGRGIKVSSSWLSFESFWKDMGGSYQDNLTLDRIDNNGNYSKENCRWVTQKEQANNRRNNHIISYKGNNLTLSQWAKITGIKRHTIANRIKGGWSIEKALTLVITRTTHKLNKKYG